MPILGFLGSTMALVLIVVGLFSGVLAILREIQLMYRPASAGDKRLFWGFVRIAFIIAAALLWADEHEKVSQLENKLKELTSANLQGRIDSFGVAPTGPNGDSCLLTVIMSIRNMGAPSIAENFRISTLRAGKELSTTTLPPVPMLVMWEGNTDRSPSVTLDGSDYLPRKAVSAPIPQGGETLGFMQVLVNGLKQDEALENETVIRVVFTDVTGKPYRVDQRITGTKIRRLVDVGKVYGETKRNDK